jgi:hypothetical protein
VPQRINEADFKSELAVLVPLHDNAPAHSNVTVMHFLEYYNVVQNSHPPYSPYPTPADLFSIP